MTLRLPAFPWDTLAPIADRAREHSDGMVDLSVGTPVDPTPDVVRRALCEASDSPGYPTTAGLLELRDACTQWLARRTGATDAGFLPTIGSKEMVAWLPTGLGIGPSDTVVIPEVSYPTYAVGATVASARVVATDDVESVDDASMVWLNSPGNPTGTVLSVDRLSQIVSWARARDIVVVSDECYLELGWEQEPVSLLDVRVNGGDLSQLLAVHSLSKRSSMAGYRFGFVAGDRRIIDDLMSVRKHLGMMVPGPIQRAAIAAYSDDEHVHVQRDRYRTRRAHLWQALESAGFSIDHSVAGLYLWATSGCDSWETARWFAERGILVAPGDFYGDDDHVRIALTATDDRVDTAVSRLVG